MVVLRVSIATVTTANVRTGLDSLVGMADVVAAVGVVVVMAGIISKSRWNTKTPQKWGPPGISSLRAQCKK